ncbi:lipid-A-disaccharide synthase [Luteimonas pelagia]
MPDSDHASPDPAARPVRIALVAGEASGDQLGAGLVEALRARYPGARFAGVGGPAMRAAGVETWHDSDALAVMGLAEVVRHLPRLLRLRRGLLRRITEWRPDVFVGIDAPDFNLGLERRLKARGIPTVHYVSPSIWAWRQGRAATIGRSADRVLCLFPMEPPVYARHGVDARFVGHPMADVVPLDPDRDRAREDLRLPPTGPVLALLPGSRRSEIERLAPAFLEAAALVRDAIPALRIVAPMAGAGARATFEAILDSHPRRDALRPVLRIVDGRARDAMVAAQVVLLASGTATLEAMLAKRPMVVGYRIAPLTHALVKGLGLLKVRRYALPNVLAREDLVPELMQGDCTPDRLAASLLGWLRNPHVADALVPRFREMHDVLRRGASERAADAVASLVGARAGSRA